MLAGGESQNETNGMMTEIANKKSKNNYFFWLGRAILLQVAAKKMLD